MTPSRMQITIELIVCSNEIASFVTTEPVKRWLEVLSSLFSCLLFRTSLSLWFVGTTTRVSNLVKRKFGTLMTSQFSKSRNHVSVDLNAIIKPLWRPVFGVCWTQQKQKYGWFNWELARWDGGHSGMCFCDCQKYQLWWYVLHLSHETVRGWAGKRSPLCSEWRWHQKLSNFDF